MKESRLAHPSFTLGVATLALATLASFAAAQSGQPDASLSRVLSDA